MSHDEIVRKSLLTAMLDSTKPVTRVEVKQIDFKPGQKSGVHSHPIPVVGLITKGSVVIQIDGQPEQIVKAGEAFYEPADMRVTKFDARDEATTFVAFYLMGDGDEKLITML
jgi:quercetin dioxygenase-like cupin family protein